MRLTSPPLSPGNSYYARMNPAPITLQEAVRVYFSILFGVAVLFISFYYLYP